MVDAIVTDESDLHVLAKIILESATAIMQLADQRAGSVLKSNKHSSRIPFPKAKASILCQAYSAKCDLEKRDSVFGDAIVKEAAWYILIEVCIANLEQRPISTSDVRKTTGFPSTTLSRHIRALERSGILTKETARHDARLQNIRLTQRGMALLDSYFT
jgi:hypothetical protein